MTGQPDFATIYISYVPHKKMVESKSLKLYLFSFRNHGDFHEDCINIIMKDLIKLMDQRVHRGMGQVYATRWFVHRSIRKLRQAWYRVGKDGKERLHFHDMQPERVAYR